MKFISSSPALHPYPFFDMPEEAQMALLNLYLDINEADRQLGAEQYGGRLLSVRSWNIGKFSFAYRVGRGIETTLEWNAHKSVWERTCDCTARKNCSHVAAVIYALIGRTQIADLLSGAREKEPDPLQAQIEKKLGRALLFKERQYLNNAIAEWRRYASFPRLSLLTLFNADYTFSKLFTNIIHPPPDLDFPLFWAVLAFQARKLPRLEIPEYMRVFENDALAQLKCDEYNRMRVVQAWKDCISYISRGNLANGTPVVRYDLRIVVFPHDFKYEARLENAAEFKPLSLTSSKRLYQALCNGEAQVLPEAVAVFYFIKEYHSQFHTHYSHNSNENPIFQSFNHLALTPEGRQRIVTPAGQPYEWPEKPLHWKLLETHLPAADAEYVLTLPNGKPIPALVRIIQGRPPLYVTPQAIYRGPRCIFRSSQNELAHETGEQMRTKIPVEALHTQAGVDFLTTHQLPPPPQIAARMQPSRLRLHVKIERKERSFHDGYLFTFSAVHPAGTPYAAWKPEGWTPLVEAEELGPTGPILIPDYSDLPPMLDIVQGPLKLKYDSGSHGAWTIKTNKSFHAHFVQWLDQLPPGVDLALPHDLTPFREPPIQASFRLECQPVGDLDWFDLKVVVHVKTIELTPEELHALVAARGKFVELPGKGWRRIAYDVSKAEHEKLARLGLQADDFSGESQRFHALQLADPAAEHLLAQDQYAEIRRRAARVQTQVAPPMPADIQAKLRPYQMEGFHFLAYLAENSFGGILADDMGLGKTLQALTWLAWLRKKHPNQPSLVVCPKSVADNWHHEAAQFFPGLRTTIWRGADDDHFIEAARACDLIVVNFSQLRSLSDATQKIAWLAAILDEGQYIKNPQSLTAVAARKLPATYRLVLTGTPIENRLLDLWSLMNFSMPGLLGPQAHFSRQYDRAGDPLARQRLSARVRPFLLRRTKNQVAPELPPRTEEDLICDMTPRQETLYRAELKAAQMRLLNIQTKKAFDNERFNFLTSLLRLRQICCHPGLFAGDDPAAAKEPGAKEEALLDLLEPLMEEGHKVLVFSQFVSVIDRLVPLMTERKWKHFVLTGDTEKRGDLVKDFQTSEAAAVFLISLKAGGFGLNLTAASYVVLFDPWWNPAVENQAIDRTHRIGQTRPVMAYRLIARHSIEEKIRQLQQSKSALASAILGEEKFAKALTLDDLRFLLSD